MGTGRAAAGRCAPPTPLPEIGWGPVMFPFPGGTEPVVLGLMDGLDVHWHYDTFDLPKLHLRQILRHRRPPHHRRVARS